MPVSHGGWNACLSCDSANIDNAIDDLAKRCFISFPMNQHVFMFTLITDACALLFNLNIDSSVVCFLKSCPLH